MKEGDLVKVLYKGSEQTYAYGILTDTETGMIKNHPYYEVWIFRYPTNFGDMPANKSIFPTCDIKPIKTFEDW